MDIQVQSKAYELLSQPQKFKSFRSESKFINEQSKTLSRLAEDPDLLKDLLDISFRPRHFEEVHQVSLSPSLPATAIEALTSLYEDLITLITYDKIILKDLSLQGFQNEEEPVQSSILDSQQFIYLTHIHKAFQDEQKQDASMSNLSRILGPVYYQSPQKIMQFYNNNPESCFSILQNLWRRDIMEIFCKLLEAESGKQFFTDCKKKFFENYFALLLEGFKGERRHEWLEGLLQLHRFLMEKIEERYDGAKYMALLETLNQGDYQVLEQVLKSWRELPDRTLLVCLRWSEECLKKDGCVWGASELRVPMTNLSRKYSMSNSFYDSQQGSKKKKYYHLSQPLLQLLASLLQLSQQKFVSSQIKYPLHLIAFYKTFYFWVKVAFTGIENKYLDLEPLLHSLVNYDLLSFSFVAAEHHPTCSALHNYIKELIIECISHKLVPCEYFGFSANPYLKTLLKWLPRLTTGGYLPMGPQSYHIYQEILKRQPDLLSSQVVLLLNDQKSRREKVIGGNDPRKMQDNLRSSNAFSESSEEIIEIDIPSLRSASSTDPGLVLSPNANKLSISLSIQKAIQESQEGEFSSN